MRTYSLALQRLMPGPGIEPGCPCGQGILSPTPVLARDSCSECWKFPEGSTRAPSDTKGLTIRVTVGERAASRHRGIASRLCVLAARGPPERCA